jgi:Na+-transporting NADH:ubiquinone oxidoreductase subunit NqrC
MDGALISATASSFDAISGATFSSDGVLACFDLVASRVSIDLGGA